MNYLDLCTPALVYLVVALIVVAIDIGIGKKSYALLLARMLVVSAVTYALNHVCIKYSTRTSWYLLAFMWFGLPLLFILITILAFKAH